VTPVLLIDQATQHGNIDTLFPGWVLIRVPKCMTHIFQPCDQRIIACMRSFCTGAWRSFMKLQFSQFSVEEAVERILHESTPMMRQRKIKFLLKALDQLSVECIVSSWEITGLLRAIFHENPTRAVIYDTIASQPGTDTHVDDWAAEEDEAALSHGVRYVTLGRAAHVPQQLDYILIETPNPLPPKAPRGRPKGKAPPPRQSGLNVLQMFARCTRIENTVD